jgi:hypothetical protein
MDVHGDGMPGMDPAEGDLLPGDHDDAGVAGPALGGERLGGALDSRLADSGSSAPRGSS